MPVTLLQGLIAAPFPPLLADGSLALERVGHRRLPDSRDFARHAQRIGADAISALAPSSFRPANVADLDALGFFKSAEFEPAA